MVRTRRAPADRRAARGLQRRHRRYGCRILTRPEKHADKPVRIARVLAALLVLSLVAAGCGSNEPTATESTGSTTTTTTMASEPGSEATTPAADLDEWQTIELTDADGQTFTMADFLGRPVFVESFATWCGNCRRQLGDTNRAAAQAGDDAVFIALSVETELDAGDMADYADKQGFDHIRFAVMSPGMLAAFNDAFGNTALNPPSTPHVAVTADGIPGELVTGYDSPEEILASLGIG